MPTTVVVVSYNGAQWIRGCVRSALSGPDDLRVIVVDNASSDGTAGIVATEFPMVELIALSENVGFGRGNNLGIRRALDQGANYVLLLNQDAFVTPDCLTQMQRFMDENQDVGVCTPLHCSPDESRLDLRTYRGYLGVHAAELLHDAVCGKLKRFYLIPGINAAVWFVRADTFRTVGGFDPLFFMYGEDDDLMARMRYHGMQFALLPHLTAVHLRQSPARKKGNWFNELGFLAGRSRASLLRKVKEPGHSATYALALIVRHGVIDPLADLITSRQWTEYVSNCLAALQVLLEFPAIRRHTVMTQSRGPHFLDGSIAGTKTLTLPPKNVLHS